MKKSYKVYFIFLLIIYGSVSSIAQTVEFKFDNDVTANPNTIATTLTGTIPFVADRCGNTTSAGRFINGIGNFVKVEDSNLLNFSGTGSTIMAWVYNTSNTGGALDQKIFSKETNNISGFSFGIKNGNISLIIFDESATSFQSPNSSVLEVSLNTWNHIAVSYRHDGTNHIIKHYLNGVMVLNHIVPGPTPVSISSKDATIGQHAYDNGISPYFGDLDELKIYNSELNQIEINNTFIPATSITGPVATNYCVGSNTILGVNTIAGKNLVYTWGDNSSGTFAPFSTSSGTSNGVSYAGANTNLLSLSAIPANDINRYVCSVSGSCGSATTTPITLTGLQVISLTSSITSGNPVCRNSSLAFTVSGVGTSPTYQWLRNGTIVGDGSISNNTLSGTSTNILTIITGNNNNLSLSGFSLRATNSCNSYIYTSSGLALSYLNDISLSPIDDGGGNPVCRNSSLAFTVLGVGTSPSYQWLRNGTIFTDGVISSNTLSGTSTNILKIITGNNNALNNDLYALKASNTCNSVTTSGVSLTYLDDISLLSIDAGGGNPVCRNSSLAFTVAGVGTSPSYQWLRNGTIVGDGGISNNTLSGTSTNILTIITGNNNALNNDLYALKASNTCNSVTSSGVSLTYLDDISLSAIDAGGGNPMCRNTSISLVVTATGANPVFRWLQNPAAANNDNNFNGGNVISGVNTSVLGLSSANNNGLNGQIFSLSVTGKCSSTVTSGITIVVNNSASITTQPTSITSCVGGLAVFSIVGSGSLPFTHKWYRGATLATAIAINNGTDGGIYGSSFSTSGLNVSTIPYAISNNIFYCVFGSGCGNATSTGATLTVNSTAGIALQPSSVFSTCIGFNTNTFANATGSGLAFNWQILNAGIWSNIANGGNYSTTNTNTLNISALPVSFSGINYRLSVTGTCGSAISQVSTVQTNLGPEVDFFGLKSKYCDSDVSTEIEAYTNLSMPFNFTAGIFSVIGSNFNPISVSGMNRIRFNPSVVTNTGIISVRYTSAPDQNGCRNILTKNTTVYTSTGINPQFVLPGATVFSNKSNGVTMAARPSVGGIGMFTSTSVSVVGNIFNPAAAVIASLGGNVDIKVTYNFVESISGCAVNVDRVLNVFDEATVFTFTPQSTLLNKSTFCSTDNVPKVINYGGDPLTREDNCRVPYSITIVGAGGIAGPPIYSRNVNSYYNETPPYFHNLDFCTTTSFPHMDLFTFTAANLSPQTYSLAYTYDQAFVHANYTRNYAFLLTWRSQPITIFPKPIVPRASQSNFSFCGANITNEIINITNAQNVVWYSGPSLSDATVSGLSNPMSVSMAQLGITTATGLGIQNFYVRQFVNGCPSDFQQITIFVLAVPSVPFFITTISGICSNDNNYFRTLRVATVSSNITYAWYLNATNTTPLSNTDESLPITIRTSTPQFFDYYVAAIQNGCYSAATKYSVYANELPLNATVVSNLITACIDGTDSDLPVLNATVNANSLIGFNWYQRNVGMSTNTLIGNGISTVLGSMYSNNYFTGRKNNQTDTLIYGVEAQYATTGCKSEQITYISIFINSIPNAPTVLINDIFCNTSNYHSVGVSTSSANTKWYETINPVSIIGTGNTLDVTPFMTPNAHLDYVEKMFYATQTSKFCESSVAGYNYRMYPPFKKFTINSVNSLPTILTPNTSLDFCSNQSIGIVTILGIQNSTIPGTRFIDWYGDDLLNIHTGFTYSLPIIPISTTIGYTFRQTVNNSIFTCRSDLTTSGFTLNINQTPARPLNTDTAFCMPNQIGRLNASAISSSMPIFNWYNSPSRSAATYIGSGTIVGILSSTGYVNHFMSPITGTIPTVAGLASSYYVSQTVNSCESPIEKIDVFINNSPVPPIATSPTPYCSGSTILPIILSGNNVKWYSYNSLTGYVLASTNPLFTPTVSNIHVWTDTSAAQKDYFYYTSQTTNITQKFIGCESLFEVLTVTIQAVPPKPTTDATLSYCQNDNIKLLTATGVLNSPTQKFIWYNTPTDTLSNLINNFQSTYNTLTDNSAPSTAKYFTSQIYKGCRSSYSSINLIVNSLPSVNFTGLNDQYCQYDQPSILIGTSNSVGVGTFTGFVSNTMADISPQIFTNTLTSGAIFNPRFSSGGTQYLIEYSFTENVHNCTNVTIDFTTTYEKPIINFNISPPITDQTCNDANIYTFNTNNLGTVTGAGIIKSNNIFTFQPIRVQRLGLDTLTYSFVDLNGCQSDSLIITYINPTPRANFSYNSNCTGPVEFTNTSNFNTTLPSAIVKMHWTIESDTSNISPLTLDFIDPDIYDINLQVTSDKGCMADTSSNIVIGSYPEVNFNWENICNGNTTTFKNLSTIVAGGGEIVSWAWNFGYNNEQLLQLGTATGATFNYPAVGSYRVTLVGTTNQNCVVTTTSTINTLPTITQYPYIETFQLNNGNWFADGIESKWIWNTTSGFNWNRQSNEDNLLYQEKSYLNSPCFDLSVLNKPMLKLDVNFNTNRGEGTLIQYSTDNGKIWFPLGNINSGINWYTNQSLISDPGNQIQFETLVTSILGFRLSRQMGWSGNSFGIVNARNVLDMPKSQSKTGTVRFRIAYASLANTTTGIAIDNFSVLDRSKISLIENFANANSVLSNDLQTNIIDPILISNKNDVVGIQYHASLPNYDDFNAFNPSDPGSRVLYYGVENVPKTVLNGRNILWNSLSSATNDVFRESLEDPKFFINLNTNIANNMLNVKAIFVANDTINDSNRELVAYLAVIEKTIDGSKVKIKVGSKPQYLNVLKQMLPSAGGTSFFGEWQLGSGRTIEESWRFSSSDVYDINQLGLVAFIQDKRTNKILQASYKGAGESTVSGITYPYTLTGVDNLNVLNGMLLFPNPASDEINILLTTPLQADANYVIISQLSNVVKTGIISQNSKGCVIDTKDFIPGIYHLKIGNTVKKIVIVR